MNLINHLPKNTATLKLVKQISVVIHKEYLTAKRFKDLYAANGQRMVIKTHKEGYYLQEINGNKRRTA